MKQINNMTTDAAGIAALIDFEDLMRTDFMVTEKRHKIHRSKVKRQRKKEQIFQ